MHYALFSDVSRDSYEICFLVPKAGAADVQRMRQEFIQPHLSGLEDRSMAFTLHRSPGKKKTPAAEQKAYFTQMLQPELERLQIRYLVVCDAEYFKTLTKSSKAEAMLGYVCDCVFGDFKVVYCPNAATVFYDPEKVRQKIALSLEALTAHRNQAYEAPGSGIIRFAAYPVQPDEIRTWLQRLLDMGCDLSCDIETFGLKHYDAGIGTITFCWSKHEGIAFPVDLGPDPEQVRSYLREFFQAFRKRMLYHNISFDAYVLIYQLFMQDILDTEGLLQGMDVLLRNWEDTKLITFLATNSCAGNKLGLKDQAQEFAGNYAQEDIKDIRAIPLEELLQYNLVDGLSTWHVYEKHWPALVRDQQEEIYRSLFQPGILDVIQMQLTGLPLDMEEVLKLKSELEAYIQGCIQRMASSPLLAAFADYRAACWAAKKNASYKKKRVTAADCPASERELNFNSAPQLQEFLYSEDFLALPEIDYTDSGLPATGADTLEKLKHHSTDAQVLHFLDALIDYKSVEKILSTFIPAFLRAKQGPDGWHYLFGNFNLGGTQSGRLSSNGPNLQNLPAGGTRWGKAVKRCFKAPPGWLFCGLDFDSLEDRISALTTKDPNKLKVYTDGYDGHCLRAFYYFRDQMAGIQETPESVNSIAEQFSELRQESKAPTFALTYQGTFMTLVNNCGFSVEKAKRIEKNYHELYRVSDAWVAARLEEAGRCGYLTCAFGLRLRTPLLHQVIRGTRATPYEAEAEGRSAGNALGQSWCLLNTRAGVEFMSRVRREQYRLSIRPCAHIHDAQYYLLRDDMDVLLYTNAHLVKAVRWQDHPDIWHDKVKLGGKLAIFHPDWSAEMGLPNDMTAEQFPAIRDKHLAKYSGA